MQKRKKHDNEYRKLLLGRKRQVAEPWKRLPCLQQTREHHKKGIKATAGRYGTTSYFSRDVIVVFLVFGSLPITTNDGSLCFLVL